MPLSVSYGALRMFVEVGRHGSLTRAAEGLGVTPGAVSQRIRDLEARVGHPLFERGSRDMRLLPQGERLFARLAPAFEAIDTSVEALMESRPGPGALTVSTTPSFAACWLAPRLGRFTARHPRIEIRIETSVRLADLAVDPVDVAIRHGQGNYPGLDVTPLAQPRLIAVGSPALCADGLPATPSDCLRFPLLQDRERSDWRTWLEANGVRSPRSATRGPALADDALLIAAAITGQGLAIVRDLYATHALATGTLRQAHPIGVATDNGYFLVTRTGDRIGARIMAFRQWLLAEIEADRAR